jgi:hypothetical protein
VNTPAADPERMMTDDLQSVRDRTDTQAGRPWEEPSAQGWPAMDKLLTSMMIKLGLAMDPVTIAADELAHQQRLAEDNERVRRRAARRIRAAIKIVMAERQTTPEAALQLLLSESSHSHRTLYDVAEDVIEMGRAPVVRWQPDQAS